MPGASPAAPGEWASSRLAACCQADRPLRHPDVLRRALPIAAPSRAILQPPSFSSFEKCDESRVFFYPPAGKKIPAPHRAVFPRLIRQSKTRCGGFYAHGFVGPCDFKGLRGDSNGMAVALPGSECRGRAPWLPMKMTKCWRSPGRSSAISQTTRMPRTRWKEYNAGGFASSVIHHRSLRARSSVWKRAGPYPETAWQERPSTRPLAQTAPRSTPKL
jgi:hypothetical protein